MAALDVGAALPDIAWPAQVELLAGRRVVRPRYEVVHGARRVLPCGAQFRAAASAAIDAASSFTSA